MSDNNNVFYISYTKAKTYKQCPYLYYKLYILKIKQDDNKYNVLGSAIHKFLELMYKNINNNKNDRDLVIFSYEEMQKEFFDKIKTFKIDNEIKEIIKYFYKNINIRDFYRYTIEAEKMYNIEYSTNNKNNIKLTCIIDRIDNRNGKYIFYDYKTNRNVKYLDKTQLYLYAYVLDSVYNVNTDEGGYILINNNFKEESVDITKENKNDAINFIFNTADEIIELQKFQKSNNSVWEKKESNLCEYCQFKNECFGKIFSIFDLT